MLRHLAISGSLAGWAWVVHESGGEWPRCQPGPRLSLEAGRDGELRTWRVGGSWWDCPVRARVAGQALHWQPLLSWTHWQSHGAVPGARHADDLTLLPLLRWRAPMGFGLHGGVHLGIGATLLSEPAIGRRRKSTVWQFTDQLGLHLEPEDARWRLGLVYRHVSNADIQRPNDSVDLIGLSWEWTH
ncbi:MAG: acyloxyacyl hydrolase [Burkholderiales bacterium]|nr:acyloxyacyl hydrolase [Burkholderiales bacterium]